MGKSNSTKTRVQPTLEKLGRSAENWNSFFGLFRFGSRVPHIENDGCILDVRYGYPKDGCPGERSLPPPQERLVWCVRNLKDFQGRGSRSKDPYTTAKRALLRSGDPKTVEEACLLLESGRIGRKDRWCILEGRSSPDICLETKDFIAVGEAKRTERSFTTGTTWSRWRDQLIRHADAASDLEAVRTGGKRCFSFFIADRDGGYDFSRYEDFNTFEQSLPHRTPEMRKEVFRTYLGHVFWQDIERAFGIEFKH